MTTEQIKDYLKKYRIDSEEQLAKHIEELKRNTKPNNEIIFPLVDLLSNEKSVLLSFFRENSKERGETAYVRTVTPFFLDEMLGKCSTQCFCDGSCKKDKKLTDTLASNRLVGVPIKFSINNVVDYTMKSLENDKIKDNTVTYTSTRHKSQAGETHKEIVGDLEGINRPPNTDGKTLVFVKEGTGFDYLKRVFKDDVITNSSRGEIEMMEVLNELKTIINKSGIEIIKEIQEEKQGVKQTEESNNYTIYVFTEDLLPKILQLNNLKSIKSILKKYNASSYRVYNKDRKLICQDILEKDDVITNSNRGEKETMEYLNEGLKRTEDSEAIHTTITLKTTPEQSEKIDKIIKEFYQQQNTNKEIGVKHNQLKPRLDVVINTQFPKALQLISLATEYGNSKYKETDLDMLNFKRVVGGSQTYFDSCARHSTDRNGLDESGLPHIIHAVWSSLAGLELWAEENNINIKEFTENYMKNLHNSK